MTYNSTGEQVAVWAQFWLETVSILPLGALGLVGNCFALLTLRRPTLKTTFHQSLVSLAICDVMFLFMILTDQIIDKTSLFYVILFPYFWNPVMNILVSSQTFMIMGIATERFLVVWMPVIYKIRRPSYSQKTHLIFYILPPVLCSIFINIPKFMETEIIKANMTDENNITVEVLDYDITKIRFNKDYIFYYTHLTRLIFTGVLPFIYLAIVNSLIILVIKKKIPSYSSFKQRSRSSSQLPLEIRRNTVDKIDTQKFSTNTSISLIVIDVIFFVCHFPRLLLNFTEQKIIEDDIQIFLGEEGWLQFFLSLNVFSLTFNSSVNCLIYFLLWKKFKNVINKIFIFKT